MSKLNLVEVENLEHIELLPEVIVYRNVLKDPQRLYEIMKKSEESSEGKYFLKTWDPWSHFGTYTQIKHGPELETAESGQQFEDEKYLSQCVNEAYDKSISHYINKYNVNLPESARYSGCSYSKYFDQIDQFNNNMTMQYHTDFITSQKDMPGEKFFITCTMYINDNYDGGDIEFYVDGELANHKPQAGDIVIFPSIEPYYHGVKTIKNGNKFFVRNFVMFDYDGSEEWLANQKRYGAYKWSKMEIDRIAYDDPRNMIYLSDGKRMTYDELTSGSTDFGGRM